MRTVLLSLATALAAFLPPAAAAPERREDLAALLAGVDGIGVPGVPGPLCVVGDDAFAVVTAAADGHPAPVVAAARSGRGRVVAFGHNGYLSPAAAGAERLFENAVRWCAGRAAPKAVAPPVAVYLAEEAAAFLRGRGFAVEEVRDPAEPGPAKVLVLDAASIPTPEAERSIARFVRAGGGLVTASLGWGAFRDVFAEYRALPPEDRPKSDAEKRDQLMVRLSRRVAKDLGPFFSRWGIPVSEAARARVADLPDFEPAEMAEFAR